MNTASALRSVSRPSRLARFQTLVAKPSAASFSTRKTFVSARPTPAAAPLRAAQPATQARTMATAAPNADTLIELIKGRRSYYGLSKELPVSKERIQDIVKEALREVPSSFNSQSNRVVVLFGADHDKFWELVTETLKAIVTEDKWESTNGRMNMFKAGAGTVLFFEDSAVVESMQSKYALYADRFPGWAVQSDGMLQFVLWTAFEAEGLGANLQHYNPLVDEKVAETWKVPATWKLNAQLVFGGRAGEAGPKEYLAIEERLKVYGA